MKRFGARAVTLTFLAFSLAYTICAEAASADLMSGFKFRPGEWVAEHRYLAHGKVQGQGKVSMCFHTAAPITPDALNIGYGGGCHGTILSNQSTSLDYQTECPGAVTKWHVQAGTDGNLHATGHTKVTQGPLPDTDIVENITYVGPACGSSGVQSGAEQMQQMQCQIVAKNYDKIKSSCLARNGAANCAKQIAQMDAVRASCGLH
jgi:hypothetical protein